MTRAAARRCWLVAVLALLAAVPAQAARVAQRVLDGSMPQFPTRYVAAPPAADPNSAPTPDLDAQAPPATASTGASVVPALTNRLTGITPSGSGYAPGSAFSPELDRRHGDLGTNLGSVLAPGLQLRVPLP